MYQPFINPSVIGSYSNLNGALFYKNQWTGFEGAPEIAGFSVNSSIKNSNHSVGLTLINDKIGISNIKDLSIAYSYKLKFNDRELFDFRYCWHNDFDAIKSWAIGRHSGG